MTTNTAPELKDGDEVFVVTSKTRDGQLRGYVCKATKQSPTLTHLMPHWASPHVSFCMDTAKIRYGLTYEGRRVHYCVSRPASRPTDPACATKP